MTSKELPGLEKNTENMPKLEDLDVIVNVMDSILSNMKSHFQKLEKNKNFDSFKLDSPNLECKTKEMLHNVQKLIKLEGSNKKQSTNTTDPIKQPEPNPINSQNVRNTSSKKKSPSVASNTQKKTIVQNNKYVINSNNSKNIRPIKQISPRPSIQQKASPRKMQVVYKENDKFVTRSLSTMLKNSNTPQILTDVRNNTGKVMTPAQNKRRTSRSSVQSNILINKQRTLRTISQTSRSKSNTKPLVSRLIPPPQMPRTNNRSRSVSSTLSKSKNLNKPSVLCRRSENSRPSLYVPTKDIMEKHIRRSSYNLRPMSTNSSRPETQGSQSQNNTQANSLNTKSHKKSSNTQNKNIQNKKCNKVQNQNPKAQNQIKGSQNQRQIEIINRINFQNGKIPEQTETIKPTQNKKSSEVTKCSSLEKSIVVSQVILNSKIEAPIKFMKNTENKKRQKNVENDKSKEKTAESSEEKALKNFNEMGDNSIKLINEKLQDIIEKIKDDKNSKSQLLNSAAKIQNAPTNANIKLMKKLSKSINITPNKTITTPTTNNNNKEVVSNNNNKPVFVNQKSFNNQLMNISSNIKPLVKTNNYIKTNIVSGKTSKQSVQSCIVPKTSNQICLPSRKLSILSPMEIVQDFVNLVNRAKRERKTYTVCGNYQSVRKAFAERGWIEKMRINLIDDRDAYRKLEGLSNFELVEGIKDRENGDKYRRIFLSKLLAGHQVDFYWDYMTNPFSVNNDRIKRTLINRFPFGATRAYTSKIGLCETLREAYWYYVEGYSNILFPRTYNLSSDDEIHAFTEDFRRTAVICLLQWISKHSDKPNMIISAVGQVPTSVFNFATSQCYNFLKTKEHKDIDEIIPIAREYEWDIFLEKFYKIVHQGSHFKQTENITAPILIDQSRYILNKLRKYVPHIDTDGIMNLWLLKPSTGSRGCGIHVCRTLKYTLETVHIRKDTKYVIQKYIERPLLIHNTKFDIRQWFLVTCMPNLHVWLYKDCYLRFSSQMYDLSRLHESIHLTNNSIQCRYKNHQNRSHALPDQNMWHSDSFRKYLSDIGQPYAWRNIIYKGMKECLIGLFMLCQDKLLTRVNSFELCGADFMLTEDFRPYLIEINSRPALYSSTKITAKMCPQVLEDVVKVTIDYARNPRASTGNFELIYKDTFNYIPPKNINSIIVEGISHLKFAGEQSFLPIADDPTDKIVLKETDELSGNSIKKILNIDPSKIRKDVKNTLEKILSIIHTEQKKPNDDSELSDENSKHFRMMLSEFVDIINCVKKKSETNVQV